jgi:isopentenyl phosphate kinase
LPGKTQKTRNSEGFYCPANLAISFHFNTKMPDSDQLSGIFDVTGGLSGKIQKAPILA